MGSCVSKPGKGMDEEPTVSGSIPAARPLQEEACAEEESHGSVDEEVPWTMNEVFGGLSSLRGRWRGDATLLERFDKVTALAQSLLRCQLADIFLLEEERNRWESSPRKVVPRTGGLDPTRLVPVEKDYIVINDFEKDAAYLDHPCVIGEPGVRFFFGIWLKSSDNPARKHGILFVADDRPRSGTRTNEIVCLMREFGDLLAGEIEKYELEIVQNMMQERRNLEGQGSGRRFGSHVSRNLSSVSSRASEESVGSLCAAADCFHGGVMVLESVLTSKFEAHWKVLYMNEHLTRALEISDSSTLIARDIWESFSVNTEDRSSAYRCMKDHVAFEMSLTLQNRYHPNAETFIFEFRPASVASYINPS